MAAGVYLEYCGDRQSVPVLLEALPSPAVTPSRLFNERH
jgi:hypothetical protein